MILNIRQSRALQKQLGIAQEILDINALHQIKSEVPKALVALSNNIELCLREMLFSEDPLFVRFRYVIHIDGLRTLSPEAGRVLSDFVYSYTSGLLDNERVAIRLRQDQFSETGLGITFTMKSKLLDPAPDAEVVTAV